MASGKRDSARLLAQMMVEWLAAGGIPGNFALRGTLPLVSSGFESNCTEAEHLYTDT